MPELYGGQPASFEVVAAATSPIVGAAAKKSWLRRTHKHYDEMSPRWALVKDFYDGNVADPACAKRHLIRRFQGEPDLAFDERVKTTEFTPWLGTILDSLAGMLFAVEDRATRVWMVDGKASALGDPAKVDSPAHRLLSDADGKGMGWATTWRQFTLDVIPYQEVWVLIDTAGGLPVVKLICPDRVPNWIDGPTGPTEVLLKESIDARVSLDDVDEPRSTESFVRYTLTGWERWTEDESGEPQKGATGDYAYVDRAGLPTLPIRRICLPIRRYVAWMLACKAKALYNQVSVRDFAQRVMGFTKLVLGVPSDESLEATLDLLMKGQTVIPESKENQGQHRYVAPDSGPITSANAIIDKGVENLWASGFKLYSDSAAQKTATQVKQDVASGVGAFLQLLKAAVDDAENTAFYLLEQAEKKDTPDSWGYARVERSDDFSTIDLSVVLDQMKARYLGTAEPMPVGRNALIQLGMDAAQQDGLPVDRSEVTVAVDAALYGKLANDLNTLGSTPAIVKARLVAKLVAACGLIDAKETIDLADGEKANLLEYVKKQAEALATEAEQANRLQSQNLLPPGQ